LGPDLGLDG
jgi:hypothetical protein